MFLTSCFASDPTKIHSAFSHLVRPFAIYAQCGLNLFFFRKNNDVCWRKEKINLLFSPVKESMLLVECWQAVDGILFQLVNGTGVFLGVLQTAMAEKTGNGLNIGTGESVGQVFDSLIPLSVACPHSAETSKFSVRICSNFLLKSEEYRNFTSRNFRHGSNVIKERCYGKRSLGTVLNDQ